MYNISKFELTDETLEFKGRTLHRIRALRSFSSDHNISDNSTGECFRQKYEVSKGDLGGWIEKEESLSHQGNCWVSDNAKVYDNVYIFDDAWVCDNSIVWGNTVIYDEAIVSGDVQIWGDVFISGNSKIYNKATVCGDVKIYGYAEIYGHAEVWGNKRIYGYTKIYAHAKGKNGTEIYDNIWKPENTKYLFNEL